MHQGARNHRTASHIRGIKEAIDKLEKDKKISQEQSVRRGIEKLTHPETKKIEDMAAAKEKEVMRFDREIFIASSFSVSEPQARAFYLVWQVKRLWFFQDESSIDRLHRVEERAQVHARRGFLRHELQCGEANQIFFRSVYERTSHSRVSRSSRRRLRGCPGGRRSVRSFDSERRAESIFASASDFSRLGQTGKESAGMRTGFFDQSKIFPA